MMIPGVSTDIKLYFGYGTIECGRFWTKEDRLTFTNSTELMFLIDMLHLYLDNTSYAYDPRSFIYVIDDKIKEILSDTELYTEYTKSLFLNILSTLRMYTAKAIQQDKRYVGIELYTF